jgi:hypothetical protein
MAGRPGNVAGSGKGSRKGIPNKTTSTAKENIIAVFTAIGGTRRMAKWAEDNTTEFYKLYGRLLPLQVTGEGGGPLDITVRVIPHDDHRGD